MQQLKITKSIMVPNIMFFHPKWLDENFKNQAGRVILVLRPTEKSNLKRLLSQSLSLERFVMKFGDIVQLLLKAEIQEFKEPKVDSINSWTDFLVYQIAIIGEYQGWDPKLIVPTGQVKSS